MNSQFDDPLPLKDSRTIKAQGPLDDWKPDDAPHCRIKAELTQGSGPDKVTGTGDTGNYNHGDARWACDVRADGGKLWDPAKPVDCHGTITMEYTPPDPDPWPDQTVALTKAS